MSDNTDSNTSGADSLGRAANRYVSFQIVSAIIGGIIFLIVLFTVFLPMFHQVNQGISSVNQTMPTGPTTTTTLTVNGHPATPEEQKSFDQHTDHASPPGAAP